MRAGSTPISDSSRDRTAVIPAHETGRSDDPSGLQLKLLDAWRLVPNTASCVPPRIVVPRSGVRKYLCHEF